MTNALAEPPTQLASDPFDDPDADLVLRTCDKVDFRVMKLVLRLASPVFKDMFSLSLPSYPSTGEGGENEAPVVTVSESSSTLDRLLRFCYPIAPPDLGVLSISQIADVLEAAQKYGITSVTLPAKVVLKLKAERNEVDAFTVYAISCRFKFKEVARAAAISCLKRPLPEPWTPSLGSISGADLNNLIEFHQNCSKAVSALLQSTQFRSEIFHYDKSYCEICNDYHSNCGSRWYNPLLTNLLDSTRSAPLDTSTLTTSAVLTDRMCMRCLVCRVALSDWDFMRESAIISIKACVEKVDLSHSWN